LATAVVVVSIVSLALIYFFPAPPSKVIIATGVKGSSFEYYAKRLPTLCGRFLEKVSHVDVPPGEEIRLWASFWSFNILRKQKGRSLGG
jgi:hypothetical protein